MLTFTLTPWGYRFIRCPLEAFELCLNLLSGAAYYRQ